MDRLAARLRGEDGFELVELLLAMTILSIGILAVVAGLSSAMVANIHANRVSTAGTVADSQMEKYRRIAFGSIPAPPSATTTTPTGPDGRQYRADITIRATCPNGAAPPAWPDPAV